MGEVMLSRFLGTARAICVDNFYSRAQQRLDSKVYFLSFISIAKLSSGFCYQLFVFSFYDKRQSFSRGKVCVK